jgi:hypothetical protein
MMLRIEGTDGRDGALQSQSEKGKEVGYGLNMDAHGGLGDEEFQRLMLEFDERMTVLRTVVDAGIPDHQREQAPETDLVDRFETEEVKREEAL